MFAQDVTLSLIIVCDIQTLDKSEKERCSRAHFRHRLRKQENTRLYFETFISARSHSSMFSLILLGINIRQTCRLLTLEAEFLVAHQTLNCSAEKLKILVLLKVHEALNFMFSFISFLFFHLFEYFSSFLSSVCVIFTIIVN